GLQIAPVTPKIVIKEAFAAKVIENGQCWIDMMLERNLLAHTYDHKTFRKALAAIKDRYLPELEKLHRWMMQNYQNG
ncbi:MAG TPA: nucleotidyltransferase substrate binding protein, partial [Chlorobaculum sp.]|nr:nucleotidyltransferase substrate binding protein [Chlorobaculum sp.]